jgi:hypothetical protein
LKGTLGDSTNPGRALADGAARDDTPAADEI